MRNTLQFDFLVDEDKNTITIRREFAGQRQLVWDCHTKSELLDQWFAPKPLTAKTKSMEFRKGGHWHYALVDTDGNHYWSRMDYLDVNPINNYSLLDGFSNEAGTINTELPRAKWIVTFSDLSDNTLVQTVVHYNSLSELETVINMGMKEGLTSTLERLDDLLASLQ